MLFRSLDNRFYLERQDPPCEFFFTSEQLELPSATDKAQFELLLQQPTFFDYDILNKSQLKVFHQSAIGGVSDLLDYSGFPPLELDVRLINFTGEYNLGQRDTAGACVDYSMLRIKDIDDDC